MSTGFGTNTYIEITAQTKEEYEEVKASDLVEGFMCWIEDDTGMHGVFYKAKDKRWK